MKQFTLTSDHITLLRNATVWWNDMEYGAPGIYPKKPYGNGDVVGDMAKLLGVEPVLTDDGETRWPPGTSERMGKLHRELEDALQIVLLASIVSPGKYVSDDCRHNWRLES